jgi:DNA-binding response OmpR family regulator
MIVSSLILMIDDDPDICEIVKVNLEGAGYNVAVATDGAAGLTQAFALKPNLVILDVLMPELDGWQVLDRLAGDPRTSSTPVIMLTCKGDDQDVMHGLSTGAVEYVTKPFYPENLVASIKILLGVLDPSMRDLRRRQLIARRQRQIDRAPASPA